MTTYPTQILKYLIPQQWNDYRLTTIPAQIPK